MNEEVIVGNVVFRRPGFAEPPRTAPPATIGPQPQTRQPTIGPTREAPKHPKPR